MSILSRLREALPFVLRSELEHHENRAAAVSEVQMLTLRERLHALELELESQGWRPMSMELEREFSRSGLAAIMTLSRYMFLKNALVNRAVTLQSIYVWGQGCTITCKDNPEVQEFIDALVSDPRNQAELFSHQSRTLKEQDLQVLGNIFFALLFDQQSGTLVIRTIPAEEVMEIITDPEDFKSVQYYRRTWTAKTLDPLTGAQKAEPRDEYYPDFRYQPDARPEMIGRCPVRWDAPVYHVKVGGLSDMKFGVPETYQSIDWARAYTKFMSDWCNIVANYAQFAWKVTTPGGEAGKQAVKRKIASTLGTTETGVLDKNPRPAAGSSFISNEGVNLEAVKTAGATTKMEDARRLLLMVAASFGMPESFFGDVSVGTLATAKSLDRPTELKFSDRQQLWREIFRTILNYAVEIAIVSAWGKLRGKQKPKAIDISMPPILEHDIKEQVEAISAAATLGGRQPADTIDRETTSTLLLSALGVENVNEVMDKLRQKWEDDEADAQARELAILKVAAKTPPSPPVPQTVEAAVNRITKALAG